MNKFFGQSTTKSNAEIRQAQANCDAETKTEYKANGGDESNFLMDKSDGANEKLADSFGTCKQSLGQNPSKAQLTTCDDVAKTDFQKAGGSADDYQYKKTVAAEKKLQNKMEQCISALPSDTPSVAEIQSCENAARSEYEKAGGNSNGFQRAKEAGAKEAAASGMMTCSREKLSTHKNPTREQYHAAHVDCDTEARKDFKKAGGSDQDFQLAKKEAARTKVGDSIEACVEALNVAANQKPSKEQRKECDTHAKKIFQEGDAHSTQLHSTLHT
jgi:hypothetical protein